MKKKIVNLIYKKRKISFEVLKVPWWYEGIGLMFSRRKKASALIFNLRKSSRMAIHSWFVFFPFVAIWLDKNKKIISIKEIRPFRFRILPSVKFEYLIEIPKNEKYDEIMNFLVGGETFK